MGKSITFPLHIIDIKVKKMLRKFSLLALFSSSYALNLEIDGSDISFRPKDVLISDESSIKRTWLFQPITAAMLNGGFHQFYLQSYNAYTGITGNKKFEPNNYICMGDGWALHSFMVNENTSTNPDDMPHWGIGETRKSAFNAFQMCDQDDVCHSDRTLFNDNWNFGKINEVDDEGNNLCAETNFYMTKKLYEKVKDLIEEVEPEDKLAPPKKGTRREDVDAPTEAPFDSARMKAFLVANPPDRMKKFSPVTPEMLMGGYWSKILDHYGREVGIKGNSRYKSESGLICLGNGWAIANFWENPAKASLSWDNFPTFSKRWNDRGYRLCKDKSNPKQCEEGRRNLGNELQFAKHPTLCQESHLWVTKVYMQTEGKDIVPVDHVEDLKANN